MGSKIQSPSRKAHHVLSLQASFLQGQSTHTGVISTTNALLLDASVPLTGVILYKPGVSEGVQHASIFAREVLPD